MEYKTNLENYNYWLDEARKMTKREIRIALQQRAALHQWAIDAYETALLEKRHSAVRERFGMKP